MRGILAKEGEGGRDGERKEDRVGLGQMWRVVYEGEVSLRES